MKRIKHFLDEDIQKFLFNEIKINNLEIVPNSFKQIYFNKIVEFIIAFIELLYILLRNWNKKKKIDFNRVWGIARVPHGKSGIEKAVEDVCVIEDYGINDSIIDYVNFRERLIIGFRAIGISIKINQNLTNFYSRCGIKVYKFYRIRIPQYALFIAALDMIIGRYSGKILYSSQIIDRFAFAEHVISKQQGCIKICIPHGLEPVEIEGEYPCDEMWCISKYTADLLSKKHSNQHFVYHEDVIKRLYTRNRKAKVCNKIVFFSQGERYLNETVYWINILKQYISKSKFYNKLIFKFRYNTEVLSKYGAALDDVIVSDDIDECLSSKVCISFYSTTLLEALYNNSYAVAINCDYLEQNPDFVLNQLSDIRKIYSEQDLIDVLDDIEKQQKEKYM